MNGLPALAGKKLIEVDLPLDIINAEAAREKSIRHGHPSTLHLWWARRPLAACRAVLFASLVDDPSAYLTDSEEIIVERAQLHNLLGRLVKWENSNDPNLLAAARYEIARSVARSKGEAAPTEPAAVLEYLNRQAQPIYDPFCGGGSIPLEAQRLGLRAVGSDLNPVAVLITKALIELPPKFANRPPVNPDADPMGFSVGKGKQAKQIPWRGAAGLAADIRYYGRKMREMAWEKIGHLYPTVELPEGGAATVIAWLWARTIPCANPACGAAMPLLKTFQVSKKAGNQHWIKPVVDKESKTVSFVVQNHDKDVPAGGNIDRNGANCVACDNTATLAYVREQARAGKLGEVMTCIVAEGDRKRMFLSPIDEHINIALSAKPEWYPTSDLPERALGFAVPGYGFAKWCELFTDRQLAVLTTSSDLLTEVENLLLDDGADKEYANAVQTYLALAVGKLANGCSSFTRWDVSTSKAPGVFARQAISMVWDFAETNPFSSSTQNWIGHVDLVSKAVEILPADSNPGETQQADAANTIHAKDGPVIVTDPPYYDNIGYADLSDFFYIWLRPLLRDIYPGLFSGILAPKDEEMVAAPVFENSRDRFENLLGKTLELIRERCSPDFPSSIFYAYKQQEEQREGRASTGWETMLTAVINAGFEVVGTWPMRTELANRPRSLGANSLASSIVLVCRPRREDAGMATRRQFFDELEREMPPALAQLTRQSHIAPVDLAQAAIGPGMQVYSRYSRVETLGGTPVTVREALTAINKAIADYDRQESGELDGESRFCLAWLNSKGSGPGSYGEADTLATAHNVVIDRLRDTHGLISAEGGVVQLRPLEEFAPQQPSRSGFAITAWEGCWRMAYHLGREAEGEGGGGIAGAGSVARQLGSNVERVERLARILYNYYDRRRDSGNAVLFNNLVTSWADIIDRMQTPEQRRMGDEV